MTLQPGTRLGHYEITSLLGSGGMGEVYRAKDHKLGRDVAIKVLREELASDPERLRRFEQEARSASALNHPNIITIYDIRLRHLSAEGYGGQVGKTEDVDFIVMEFVEGKTLREVLADGPPPIKKLFQLATQIAEGLAKAHSAGIIHRDLKPENLMVTSDGYVKILDFGLAKLLPEAVDFGSEEITVSKELTRAGVILGTVGYMSPEQASGQPLDHRSDQFSFGSILYEMATGKIAFKRETAAQMLAAIIEGEPEPVAKVNPNVPPHLRVIVERCLEKHAEERYESTRDLARELEGLREIPFALPAMLTRRAVLAGVLALVVLGLALLVGLNGGGLRDRLLGGTTPIDSLAVLPLANASGDPEQEYFVDGITEALITDLAKISALKVISRNSAMRYKDTDKSIPEIAEELGVDAVIEGSVLREGDRVRVTAQLIEASTDQYLWANNFEQELRDIMTLYSDVARTIAREIEINVAPEEERRLASVRPVVPEAYEAYLKGRFYHLKITPEGFETAQKYFQLALEKDPNYALAYAGMAFVWLARADWGVVPPREAIPKAKTALSRANELDENLAEIHRGLAFIEYSYEWDWLAAERAFKRAIELNPNYGDVRIFYSHFLICMKRPEEARAQMARALELDPLQSFTQGAFGMSLFYLHRYDEAIEQLRKTLVMEPNFSLAHQFLWFAYPQKRMFAEALEQAKKYFSIMGNSEVTESLAHDYAQGGYAGAMRLAAEKLAARAKLSYVPAMDIAYLYGHAGERKRTLEWLERCYEERELDMVSIGVNPIWDSLREDARFQDLLRLMNLPE